MKSRSRTAVWVLVAVVSALAIGGLAPATAAGLSKGAVRKIATKAATKVATKVVQQQAASLSVAHAASADRATTAGEAATVGGRSAADLQTTVHDYPIGSLTPASSHVFSFPGLAAGSYLVSFTVAFTSAPAAGVGCYLRADASMSNFVALTYFPSASTSPTCNNTALLTVAAGNVPTLTVSGSGLITVPGGSAPSSVVFTEVDSVVSGAPTGG